MPLPFADRMARGFSDELAKIKQAGRQLNPETAKLLLAMAGGGLLAWKGLQMKRDWDQGRQMRMQQQAQALGYY